MSHSDKMKKIALGVLCSLLISSAHSFPFARSYPTISSCDGNTTCDRVHVFRVTLNKDPEEGTDPVPIQYVKMKPRKKYGSNVYVPKGNYESKLMTSEILQKMPENVDKRVHERIRNEEFYLAPVEDGTILDAATIDHLFGEERTAGDVTQIPPRRVIAEEDFPIFLTLLLVAIGIVVGILCTCLVLFALDYKRKPNFDRSGVISYKRSPAGEKVVYDPQRKTFERNVEMQTRKVSTRTPGHAVRAPPRVNRMVRETEMLRAASRESNRRMHSDRKISF